MQRSIGIKWGKLRVGILLLFAVVVVFWASLTGGGTSIFQQKKSFVCYFRNISGLMAGSPVWLSGLEVGNVSSIKLVMEDSLRQLRVSCRVRSSVWKYITEDAQVQLGTVGFLGDKYVEIIPGDPQAPVIEEWTVLSTKDVGSAPAMFEAGEEAFSNAGSVVSGLDTLLMRMNAGEGTLGRLATDEELYAQLTRLLANLTDLTSDLQGNQERLVSSIERMSGSIGDLTEQVNENSGTLGKLISDPALYDNVSAASARLDSVLTKIDQAEGNVGLLVNDTALYVELTNLMARANSLISDIEKNPRRYFKFSVF